MAQPQQNYGSTQSKLEFRWVILQALNRTHLVSIQPVDEDGKFLGEHRERLRYGVNVLATFLAPYEDDKFRTDIIEVKAEQDENSKVFLHLKSLIKLCARLGLLLERKVRSTEAGIEGGETE